MAIGTIAAPKSLKWQEGTRVLPGIMERIYYVRKEDIVNWPLYDKGKYNGSFVLAEGVKFQFMDIKMGKSPVSAEPQGEKPSKTFLSKATFVHPGTEEDATEFCEAANNDDYLYIVQTKTGKLRVIGHQIFRTDTKPSIALGAEVTDESGTTLEVSCTTEAPLPFYTGGIPTAEGTVNFNLTNDAKILSGSTEARLV